MHISVKLIAIGIFAFCCVGNFLSNNQIPSAHAETEQTYELTVITAPTTGGVITGAANKSSHTKGGVVRLSAVPLSGYTFLHWGGACTGTDTTCSVTMNMSRYVSSYFMYSNVSNTNTSAVSNATPSSNDPGSGSWLPEKLANGSTNNGSLMVFDQSDGGSITYVPGCINFRDAVGSSCRHDKSVTTQFSSGQSSSVALTDGKTIAIRYMSASSAATSAGRHKITNVIGGDVNASITTSISQIPGDFSNPLCTKTSDVQPMVNTGSSPYGNAQYCQLKSNARYYINIRANSGCGTAGCAVAIDENSQLQ